MRPDATPHHVSLSPQWSEPVGVAGRGQSQSQSQVVVVVVVVVVNLSVRCNRPGPEPDLDCGPDQAAERLGGPVVITWPSGSRSVSARQSPSSMTQPSS